MEIHTLVEEKINSDSDFQATLADMSEEDQAQAIADKRTELLNQEFTSLSEKAAKAEELAKNQKIRAEKAEAATKQQKVEEPKKSDELSLENIKNIRALQDVHDDDAEKVINYAKFNGISIAEAKKLPEIQALLKIREEERKTAQATNIGKGGKATSKITGETLLEKAEITNEIPESEDGLRALVQARIARKLAEKS